MRQAQKHKVSKYWWENGTNQLAQHQVATKLQFVNNISVKCNEVKHNEKIYAYILSIYKYRYVLIYIIYTYIHIILVIYIYIYIYIFICFSDNA